MTAPLYGPGSKRSAAIRECWRRKYATQGLPPRWQQIEAMEATGMSQSAIARALGISQPTVWKLLQKIREMKAA